MEMVMDSSSILEIKENQGGHYMLYSPLHHDAPEPQRGFALFVLR
jgi:hypothetical protein